MPLSDSRSREGAWIEIIVRSEKRPPVIVAPARERGLKCSYWLIWNEWFRGRSREGAWIEILKKQTGKNAYMVAPARERGLK